MALLFYKMPVSAALASAVYGFFYGLWPIAWIIVAAVFLYKLSVKTGQFDVIRSSILSVTHDQRLQLILVGFASAFPGRRGWLWRPCGHHRCAAGGPGLQAAVRRRPVPDRQHRPVAFGAMGIPVIVAGQVSGIDPFLIGQMAGRQLPFMTILVLFWIMGDHGRLARREGDLACRAGGWRLVRRGAVPHRQLHRPELPDITSAIVSLIALTAFPQVWQPKRIFRFDTEKARPTPWQQPVRSRPQAQPPDRRRHRQGLVALHHPDRDGHAVEPQALQGAVCCRRPAGFHHHQHPRAHARQAGRQDAPGGRAGHALRRGVHLQLAAATGTAILIRRHPDHCLCPLLARQGRGHAGRDGARAGHPIYSIGMVLAFAFVANYSGLSATLALALAHTGQAFVFFSPFLGWIGVFLTGSDTSANALFGALQATTANQLGLSPVLTVAANTTGGVTGKMISPQSIAIACAAVGLAGKESDLFRFTVKHSLVFAAIIGIICTLQAYVFTWMIPGH